MDIIQLYQDFSVDFLTEGHKHCRPGWVNTPCPFCTGNPGYHLGYETSSDHYYCWRCGWHATIPTLSQLLNISLSETQRITKLYGILVPKNSKNAELKVKFKPHKLPSNVQPLGKNHKQYLEGRRFDADKLETEWNLVGTGPISSLSTSVNGKSKIIDYRFRIVIPYIWNNQEVSFDTRDITGHSNVKYIACPKDRELIPHKEVLYGDQSCWGEVGIGVEGTTDVWRLGKKACALSGIEYTMKQVRIIAKTFKRFAVVFDGQSETSKESQAFIQANKLVGDLKMRGVDAFRVDILGDPASMEQNEADYLVKQLIK